MCTDSVRVLDAAVMLREREREREKEREKEERERLY